MYRYSRLTLSQMECKIYLLLCISLISSGLVQGNDNGTLYGTTWSPELRSQELQCPPWFFYNTTTYKCECYHNLSDSEGSIVLCTDKGALLRNGYCMTHEEGKGTFVSRCIYFEVNGHNRSGNFTGFITLPDNISQLNNYMCGPMNRKGLVCGECIEGYGLSFVSIRPTCTVCSGEKQVGGILLYLFLTIVPITVIYLFFLVYNVGLTSSPFTAFVFFSQTMFILPTIVFAHYDLSDYWNVLHNSYADILFTFYGFWDLHFFFIYFMPPICISTTLSMLGILLLRHVVIIYPILLICLTWLCIHLYSRNFKLFVWLWRRISPLFNKMKKDAKFTVIDMFSTFLLLSYSKSFEQLIFIAEIRYNVILYNMNNLPTCRLLSIDPSIKLFGYYHLVFVLVPFILFSIVLVPPVIFLALYPLKRCRPICVKCACGGRRRAALNIFVEKYYSCYRDGLDGGRDMRSFASLYFIIKIIFIVIGIIDFSFMYTILIGSTAFFIALVQPYKKYYMNILDSLLLANLTFIYLMAEKAVHFQSSIAVYAIVIASSIPMWVLCLYVIYKIFQLKKLLLFIKKKLPSMQKLCPCYNKADEDKTASQENKDSNNLEIPDRIVNPDQYEEDNAPTGVIKGTHECSPVDNNIELKLETQMAGSLTDK